VFDRGSYRLTVPVDVDVTALLSAARDVSIDAPPNGRPAPGTLHRGECMVHRIGVGHWVDDLERDVCNALATVATSDVSARLPNVEYVRSGGRHIAYQDRGGEGPAVLLLPGLASHCVGIWDAPGFSEWVSGAVGPRRLVMFDKRGTGLSDAVAEVPSDQDFADDALMVLRNLGITRVVLICAAEAGMYGPHIAIAAPDLVVGVVFINATAHMFETPDFPCGLPERKAREFGESLRETWARENSGLHVAAPSRAGDARFERWATDYQRLAATPGSIWKLAQYTATGDGRRAIEAMTQPSIVLQSRNTRYFRPSNATWLCDSLGLPAPVWLNSEDHLFWVADPARGTEAIANFLGELDQC